MHANPAISFLLCTRNRADIVRECVLHLLESPRKDIEIVVRDNCSTDNTLELLNAINDERLKLHVAPENQGTLSFYEISKLASGDIVTWLSDEDNFQFSALDFILDHFKRDSSCNVMFGGIVVGAKASKVIFPDAVITDTAQACITTLAFSGCGGLFVRRTALPAANSFKVHGLDDAYALWNYYPVGFFASRCMTSSLTTTSRVVVVQSRFARTTHNWSKMSDQSQIRAPHYYPESVFDRLTSNIVNVWLKPLPLTTKLRITKRLIHLFRLQATSFSDPALRDLLLDNYSKESVQSYLGHVKKLNLDTAIGRYIWATRKIFFLLPLRLPKTLKHWRNLSQT